MSRLKFAFTARVTSHNLNSLELSFKYDTSVFHLYLATCKASSQWGHMDWTCPGLYPGIRDLRGESHTPGHLCGNEGGTLWLDTGLFTQWARSGVGRAANRETTPFKALKHCCWYHEYSSMLSASCYMPGLATCGSFIPACPQMSSSDVACSNRS